MTISQKEYHHQYYLSHRDHIRSNRKDYYYRIRGTSPKVPKTDEELLKERTIVCPHCKKSRTYSSVCNALRAKRTGSICNSCANTPKHKGRKLTPEHKLKISMGNIGKVVSNETKRRLREARVRELRIKYEVTPNYNSKACQYFDRLSKERNWHLQHAENGGEITKCGYFLDAYDITNNIVVEYDEKKHRLTRQKLRDKQKQKELIEELKCHFFRYDEISGILTQYS